MWFGTYDGLNKYDANEQLFSRQEEINAQYEELVAANDELLQRQQEIMVQRDLLAQQNQELIGARA